MYTFFPDMFHNFLMQNTAQSLYVENVDMYGQRYLSKLVQFLF